MVCDLREEEPWLARRGNPLEGSSLAWWESGLA